MSDLKTQIFSIIKKRPCSISTRFGGHQLGYVNDNVRYLIGIDRQHGGHFVCTLDINKSLDIEPLMFKDSTFRKIELTEKEYMDLKWSIEAWKEQMEEQDLEEFKDFAESEPGTMDDLLHD